LEPSCLFTLKDEFKALRIPQVDKLEALAMQFEEFVVRERGRIEPALQPLAKTAWLHGHCHQKAFDAVGPVEAALLLVPGLRVQRIQSGCCGMAGAFGFEAAHYEVSKAMAEADLLPAVRAIPADGLIVADGTSCRHQILDGAGRHAVHAASVLAQALAGD
jgi:Fe-S oxidoreductase